MREIKVKIEALTDLAVGDRVSMNMSSTSGKLCERLVMTPPMGMVIGLSYRSQNIVDGTKAMLCSIDYIRECNGMKIVTTNEPEYICAEEAIPAKVSTTSQCYTNAKREEFRTLAEPLVKWLQENGNPHNTITITYTRADLHSGEFGFYIESPG